MSEQLNIVLNGNNVKGNKGESILDLAKRNGVKIPTLCHDPRLEPYTSCYLCVVEVSGMRGLQPACSTRISEGMVIETSNEKVFKARKTALDLLLSNHYADCLGPCKQTCPAGVDVQGYISLIEKGMYSEAVAVIKETNPLPAICGRVCVRPCEVACRRNLLDEGAAVGIDYLKRFAADADLTSDRKYKPHIKSSTGKKVAVIGAGPGGLSAAFFLQKEGHQCDIYEASPKPGGWLRYGIPEYRLPNDILDSEVANITGMGVNIHYNRKLGDNLSYADIQKNYDATILAIGSQKGTSIGCEGDDAGNVFSGIDFLKKMEITGEKFDFTGKTVGVIGGGNTAMDCCRSALRCGASKVVVVYRRTEKEMPANPIEIHESKLEGVEYMFLTAPVKVNKDAEGNITSLTCVKMELGEPDASGRRRPVTVPGSDFEVPMDYALAAIGQKTVADFIEDINRSAESGKVAVNKWGDLDANPDTLQTGMSNVFACGDGVTGPATLIQAVAQARIAAHSCNLFLRGESIVPMKKEFLSKRDNFKTQDAEDYKGKYLKQLRHEMPTLDPGDRKNFREVELGYENEDVAIAETQRCLECGCTEYFSCDLKKYASEYGAEQKRYDGEFREYQVDFRHKFIEIDNNKCILCARCVRICREVVGANALGLINRGFKTYVAPAMGNSLTDTDCESCGMCISTCPTGAITENFAFKPGPVKTEETKAICHYCSVGCEITLHHRKDFIMRVSGSEGSINSCSSICRFPKFGYRHINLKERIKKPLIRVNGTLQESSFEEAYAHIAGKIQKSSPENTAFFAGARLSNEEIYLIQKLARRYAGTPFTGSFHYLGRGDGYDHVHQINVPFTELDFIGKIWLVGSELNKDNAVAGFMAQARNIPMEVITTLPISSMEKKTGMVAHIKDYFYFIRAACHYLLNKGLENALFIKDHCEGFDSYREQLLSESFAELASRGADEAAVIAFAEAYNLENHAVIVYSEKEITAATAAELFNLALITGKAGKTASGLLCLKEKNNSQGLFDMGMFPNLGVGGVSADDKAYLEKASTASGLKDLPSKADPAVMAAKIRNGEFRNLFIFGEDPVGCAFDKEAVSSWLSGKDFLVVYDYFITETAALADVILPASFPHEWGGTYTNTQKFIQRTNPWYMNGNVALITQLQEIMRIMAAGKAIEQDNVFEEMISMLPAGENNTYHFASMQSDSPKTMFRYGCDIMVKKLEEEMN